ncbi:MAG: DNA N-6-adenine-methyltransferase [Nanoarchaeota archaeon]
MLQKAMVSSKTFEWETPQELFDNLNKEFKFTLDVCANKNNAKCKKYFTIKDDALKQDWGKNIVFMNPPYSRLTNDFVEKGYKESLKNAIVVCLISVGTNRSYWHNYIFPFASQIRWIRGCLKFSNSNSAPFASAIIIFDKKNKYKEKYIWNYHYKSKNDNPPLQSRICN